MQKIKTICILSILVYAFSILIMTSSYGQSVDLKIKILEVYTDHKETPRLSPYEHTFNLKYDINDNKTFFNDPSWKEPYNDICIEVNSTETERWWDINRVYTVNKFTNGPPDHIKFAFRYFENDEGSRCISSGGDDGEVHFNSGFLSIKYLEPGTWSQEYTYFDDYFERNKRIKFQFMYTIPTPEDIIIDKEGIRCGDSEVTLNTKMPISNTTGLLYDWSYKITSEDYQQIIPGSKEACIDKCQADYPGIPEYACEDFYCTDDDLPKETVEKWYNISDKSQTISFLPQDLAMNANSLQQSENFVFKVRARSADGFYSSNMVKTFQFAPSGPKINASQITYQEACFNKKDGVIHLPEINAVSSVKYILKDEKINIPCDPELSTNCFINEGEGEITSERTITGAGKGRHKLWLINPGGDFGSCYSIYDVDVPELDQLLLNVSASKEVSCNNYHDGSIEFNSIGGHSETIKYKYSFDGKETEYTTPQILKDRKSGSYTISVFDKCTIDEFGNPKFGDENQKNIKIHNPSRVSIENLTNIDPTCLDPGNGKITLKATNSESGKYIYQLQTNNDQPIEKLTNQAGNYENDKLKNGDFKVIVLDNQRPTCPGDTQTFTLNPPQAIILSETDIIPPACPGENGTIGLVANGESLSFEYILKDENKKEIGRNKTGQFDASPGEYYVSVRYDIPGCKDVYNHSEKLSMPGQPAPKISLNPSNASCYGGSDGSILAVIDQNKNFSYQWQTYYNGGWASLPQASSPQVTGLEAGEYRLQIEDKDKGCSFTSKTITISQPEALKIDDLQLIKTGCTASTTKINMSITGGKPPYTWYYSKENGGFIAFTIEDQLSPGNYQFSIKDQNGCEVNYGQEVIITEQAINLKATVTPVCYKSTNGSLMAEVMGGEEPYSYSIDNGATYQQEASFDQLAAGNYQLLVKDSRGCEASLTIEVPARQDTPELNFLVATRQNALDTLVIKEISNPKPDSLHWQFDPRAIVIDDNPWEPMVKFMQEGDYPVSITAWFGACEYTMEKILHIRPFDPNAYVEIPTYERPIKILTANPNPSTGEFKISVKMLKKQSLMITVTDVKGLERYRKLYQEINELETVINLSQEVEGTYLLRAVTENDVRELKIILQK